MLRCVLALLFTAGVMTPCQVDAQHRVGLSGGIFVSDVGSADMVSAATFEVPVLSRSDHYVAFRSHWWRDSPQVWGLGVYWGERLTTRRYLYGEFGPVVTGRKPFGRGVLLRPGAGFGAGFVIDPPGDLQIKIGTSIIRDSKQGFYSVGVSLCLCPSVQ